MTDSRPSLGSEALVSGDIHEGWARAHRQRENNLYYDALFEFIESAGYFRAGSRVVDAGCGYADHSIRLARMGIHVHALDFSPYCVEQATRRISELGLNESISIHLADLTSLELPSSSVDGIFCNGVLMHVPEFDTAIKNLSRILKPGGYLLVTETNMHAPEFILRRVCSKLFSKHKIEYLKFDDRVEHWIQTPEGPLVIRALDMSKFVKKLDENGLKIVARKAGEFSELYSIFSSILMRRLIIGFNRVWFTKIGIPSVAVGNLVVVQKNA